MEQCSFCGKEGSEVNTLVAHKTRKRDRMTSSTGSCEVSLKIDIYICNECVLVSLGACANYVKPLSQKLMNFLAEIKKIQNEYTPICFECGNLMAMSDGSLRCPQCHSTNFIFPEKEAKKS